MIRHELKTWPIFFEPVGHGIKPFEVRQNDRSFQTGDTLLLREWEPDKGTKTTAGGQYTGRELTAKITYVMHGGFFGLAPGYSVLGLSEIKIVKGKLK